MKNLMKSSLVVFVFLVGSAFMPDAYKFEPLPTGKVTDNVAAINDKFVNVFVVSNGSKYIVIDAGSDAKHIQSEMLTLKINPDDVEAVLFTHTHPDHVGASALFKNAVVYVSALESAQLRGVKAVEIRNDTVFKIGKMEIAALLTPGHTPGSVSYVVDKQNLFVGDAFSLVAGKVARPNAQYSKDMPLAVKSFQKINKLKGVKYIFTAHTGMTSDYAAAVQTEL